MEEDGKALEVFKKHLYSLVDLENELLKLDQFDIPTTHTFMGGVYARQIIMPKGSLIIGKRHRHKTCNVVVSGKVSIYMGDDVPILNIDSPFFMFESAAGVKKMLYAHTDTVFTTFHPTEETDLDKLEQQFIIPEEEMIPIEKGDTI